MVNHQQLLNLVARAERGALLPGEADILRDALNLLDDLATTLDKLMGKHAGDYETDSTQSLRVVQLEPKLVWRDGKNVGGGKMECP